mmetsp:Transcript_5435/g.20305  ORF Transcript_5435/g.20305 Transcript_5435/m.20305 type:complete len:111 (-) Transcript_5435:235-567(-)
MEGNRRMVKQPGVQMQTHALKPDLVNSPYEKSRHWVETADGPSMQKLDERIQPHYPIHHQCERIAKPIASNDMECSWYYMKGPHSRHTGAQSVHCRRSIQQLSGDRKSFV